MISFVAMNRNFPWKYFFVKLFYEYYILFLTASWSAWSTCDATCGVGVRMRERECAEDDEYCDAEQKKEIAVCLLKECHHVEHSEINCAYVLKMLQHFLRLSDLT